MAQASHGQALQPWAQSKAPHPAAWQVQRPWRRRQLHFEVCSAPAGSGVAGCSTALALLAGSDQREPPLQVSCTPFSSL